MDYTDFNAQMVTVRLISQELAMAMEMAMDELGKNVKREYHVQR